MCASLLGCASASATPDGASGVTGSGGLGGSGGGGPLDSGGAGGAGGGVEFGGAGGSTIADDCAPGTHLVYLFGSNDGFYSFYPPTLEIKLVGYLDCPPISGLAPTPFSMAIDRRGIAWVEYSNGRLYNVDIETAACTPTDYEPVQHGFINFGMGFVSDTPGGEAETLYVSDYVGKGLAKIDTQTLTLSLIGPYFQFQGLPSELTGTGSGRLFGFFHTTPDVVAELDKSNAEVLSVFPQESIHIANGGFAFAFWGGDFYTFTKPNDFSSQIDKFNHITGETTTVKTDVGFTIVGAGVSTCAPFEPPA